MTACSLSHFLSLWGILSSDMEKKIVPRTFVRSIYRGRCKAPRLISRDFIRGLGDSGDEWDRGLSSSCDQVSDSNAA